MKSELTESTKRFIAENVRTLREAEASASRKRAGVSYATDADTSYIEKFLPSDSLCSKVAAKIYDNALDERLSTPVRGYWTGLVHFLMDQPKGARIRDCRQTTLAALVSRTLARENPSAMQFLS